ncbi:MAG: hypothetical protein Ct9H300mP8_06530 [Gammaproteobacteria bacterium]|nr:MAG: hypothetical protein Ct9H300mP8_06530 [Gammaproteobacteria bacterium]
MSWQVDGGSWRNFMEDLAELAIPELIEIVEGLDEDEAADSS